MDNLPRIPKDYDKINELIGKLSPYDLELLKNMDEHSQKWFFDTAKTRLEMRKEQSKSERFRFAKFFFAVVAFCALCAISLTFNLEKLSIIFWIFCGGLFVSFAVWLISTFIQAIASHIKKTHFSMKEHILRLFGISNSYDAKEYEYMGVGFLLVSMFLFFFNAI